MKHGIVLLLLITLHVSTATAQKKASYKVQSQDIVTSLQRLGQPTADARALVALNRVKKADLPLLSRVVKLYRNLSDVYCGEPHRMRAALSFDGSVLDWCTKESYPMMLALSRGNIALHFMVSQAKGLGSWSWSKDPEVRQVQFFRAERTWGFDYGWYYSGFGKWPGPSGF